MNDASDPYSTPEPIPTVDDLDVSPSHDDRNLAILAHLSGCAGIALGGLVGFIGPLVIYLWKKDTSPYVETQAKEALNFQITLLVVALGCIVVVAATCGFAFPLLFVQPVMQVVFGIIAALAVRDGSHYRYPFNLRLLQ